MKRVLVFLIVGIFWNCAYSVDFIPDPNFSEENPFYSKTKPEEVEILYERPRKDFTLVGTVIFRNFINPNSMKSELYSLQSEMLRLKVDGVWVYKNTIETIPPLIINTQNEKGMIVAYNETNREMGKLMGYPFRYRKMQDNDPKKVR